MTQKFVRGTLTISVHLDNREPLTLLRELVSHGMRLSEILILFEKVDQETGSRYVDFLTEYLCSPYEESYGF